MESGCGARTVDATVGQGRSSQRAHRQRRSDVDCRGGRDRDRARIGPSACAVVSPDPIIVGRVSTQTAQSRARDIAEIKVLITADEAAERAVGRHVQPVSRRPAHAVPGCYESAADHALARIRRRGRRYHR